MNFRYKGAAVLTALAFGATPALVPALATAHGKAGTHTTSPSFSSKAKRYGKACLAAGESKHHVKGVPGTPFSACVHAMKTKANDSAKKPATVCKAEKRFAHHTPKGQKGTPFSDCVTAVNKTFKSSKP